MRASFGPLLTTGSPTAAGEGARVQMATKTAAAADSAETREDSADGASMDVTVQAVKKLIAKGKERGYVTIDELNAALPPDLTSSEQIEDVTSNLSEMGINVVENEESDDTAAASGDADGEGRNAGNLDDDDVGRTDDPVRMYLREMGSVELLSREGEIAIAKRIEAGREMMIGGICESPLTIRAMIEWHSSLKDGKMLLRDIIDLDATYGASPEGEALAMTAGEAEAEDEAEPEAEGSEAAAGGSGDEDDGGISLSAMEEALKPQVLETFEAIEQTYQKMHKLQEQRLTQIQKGEAISKQSDSKYDKLKEDMVRLMDGVHLNNVRIEQLVEQLYAQNRKLMGLEGQLMRLVVEGGVSRESFLQNYFGHELDPNWIEGCRSWT
jgi:RNA polymerase primary sigma factor